MTAKEFKEEVFKLREEFDQSQKKLEKRYIKSQIKFKVGDIIKQGRSIIKITSYTYFYGIYEPVPSVVYKGEILTNKLTPNKSKSKVVGRITGNDGVTLIKGI
jgi:hypothetical protein